MQTKEFRKRISLTVFLLGTLFSVSKADDQVTMDLSLSIVNTFTGSFEINGIAKTTNGITYIKHNPTLIRISSDVAGHYLITWDIQWGIISGTENIGYITSLPATLLHTNTPNSLHLQFFKWGEVLVYPTITLQLDTTPPTKPILNTPTNTTITNGSTLFSRSNSSDIGAGFKEFTLFVATDSNFTNNVLIQSTPNNELIINTDSLPSGKLYWMIISSDEVTNTINSDIGYICNKQSCSTAPASSSSSSQWGWWGSIASATKLAKLIEEAKTTEAQITENKPEPKIDTATKAMFNTEQINAYTYAYNLWITTQPSIQKAALASPLIRKDLAKMISEYAIKVLNKKPNNAIICWFEDITGGDLEIQYYTKLACKLWLMGRQANGIQKAAQFNPFQEVTRAQFSTIFSRLLYGNIYNVKPGEKVDRYTKHIQALNKNNIITKIDTPQAKELRWRVMTMMMRADKDSSKKIGHTSAQ